MKDVSERAKLARAELELAILDYLRSRPDGAINSEIARDLGLQSDFEGRQKDYLTYCLLGGLLKRGLVVRLDLKLRKPFKIV